MGERGAMLGGAYTALSEDISGSYYNPAGLAFIDKFSLSMTANMYSLRKESRKDENGSVMKVDTVDLLPTTFGFNLSWSRVTAAFSIYQTDQLKFSSIYSNGVVTDKFEIDMKSYLMGPSVAVRLLNSLSVGTSLFYRYYKGQVAFFIGSDDALYQSDYTYGGLIVSVGAKYHVIENLKIGINYQAESIFINGKNTYVYTDTSAANNEVSDTIKGEMRSPHRIAAGVAWESPKAFTISCDFIYYLPIDYSQPHEMMSVTDDQARYKEKAHFDISLGGEVFLNDSFSLRMGFFTNTSGAPVEKKAERVNMYGGTFGLGYYRENLSSGIGFSLAYADTDYQTGTNNPVAAKYRRLAIGITLGGSVQF